MKLKDGQLGADCAAIAGRRAAEIYGLDLVEEGIEDDDENFTRFLILSLVPAPSELLKVPCKTSVAFSLDNEPGILCKALGVFSVLNIDMTKIESRHVHPLYVTGRNTDIQGKLRWSYMFHADVAADYNDPKTRTAFNLLSEIT